MALKTLAHKVEIKKIFWIYFLAFFLIAFSLHSEAQTETTTEVKTTTETKVGPKKDKKTKKTDAAKADSKKGSKQMFAIFETNKGTFKAKLYTEKSPKTVENFVGLAEGTKEWTDPKTSKKVKRPFYDGLVFHRVIPNFMIQGGCPMGTGTGDPGYKFEDEFSDLKHDKKGLLSMANAGPNTNGSQFFVTTALTPWLDNKHTIFGEVVEGYDVVEAIEKTKTGAMDRPVEAVVMKHVKIVRE